MPTWTHQNGYSFVRGSLIICYIYIYIYKYKLLNKSILLLPPDDDSNFIMLSEWSRDIGASPSTWGVCYSLVVIIFCEFPVCVLHRFLIRWRYPMCENNAKNKSDTVSDLIVALFLLMMRIFGYICQCIRSLTFWATYFVLFFSWVLIYILYVWTEDLPWVCRYPRDMKLCINCFSVLLLCACPYDFFLADFKLLCHVNGYPANKGWIFCIAVILSFLAFY